MKTVVELHNLELATLNAQCRELAISYSQAYSSQDPF